MAGRHVINAALEDLCAVLLFSFIRLADAFRARHDPIQAEHLKVTSLAQGSSRGLLAVLGCKTHEPFWSLAQS